MSYVRPTLTHNATKGSTGLITSAGANEEVDLSAVNCIWANVFNGGTTAFTVKVNAETDSHYVPVGATWSTGMMKVTKLTIVESGSDYSYTAGIVQ